ncbi:MAG TPA: replication initiation factor domain-containing protein [Anaerolineae bacterium]|nr:replication initiation factor domain-containing protein [Anaerolineae bacterium]
MYLNPIRKNEDYFHIEIPGKACDHINWEYFQALEQYLSSNFNDQYKYRRLDFAFDNVPFNPQDVEHAIKENQLRSLAKRETLKFHGSPFQLRDNDEIGTYTVELGSSTSQRMITVYNKRGPTRLEFQMRDKRAHLITCELFGADNITNWYEIMIGHLRDYVDFSTPWWDEFTQSIGRAWVTLSNPKEVSMEKILNWYENQIAPAFSVIVDTQSSEVINKMINRGRNRRGARYNFLLDPRGASINK